MFLQSFSRELTDCLEHPVPRPVFRLAAANEALSIRTGACPARHRRPSRRPRRSTPLGRREAAESRRSFAEQSYDQAIVARNVAWRGSASCPVLEEIRLRQPIEQLSRWNNEVRAAAAPGQAAGCPAPRRAGRHPRSTNEGSSRASARNEEGDAVVLIQRRHWPDVLTLQPQPPRLSRAASGRPRRAVGKLACNSRQQVLGIVEHQERAAPASFAASVSASARPGSPSPPRRATAVSARGGRAQRANPGGPSGYASADAAAACNASRVRRSRRFLSQTRMPSVTTACHLCQFAFTTQKRRRRHRKFACRATATVETRPHPVGRCVRRLRGP